MIILEEKIVPHIYLDANIIVDIIQGQRNSSIHLIETIKNKVWICSTSAFSYMEVLDIMQENKFIYEKMSEGYPLKKILRMRNDRDLSSATLNKILEVVKNRFFKRYKIYFYDLSPDGWSLALGLGSDSNISAPDCIHLATAMEAGCDLLITSDETFCNKAIDFMPTSLPEKFEDALKKIGFNI